MTKKDVAIFGGAFDPVHNGHMAMACYLADNYLVDEVWMMPSYNPPFKDINKIADFNHRVNMLKLAIDDKKRIVVNTFEEEYYYERLKELKSDNCDNSDIKTYSYDVLNSMKAKCLNTRFHFICGFDAIKSIQKWYKHNDLIKEYWFYIFDREDDEFKTTEQKKYYLSNLGKKDGINFYFELFDYKVPTISSTYIKNLLKNRQENQTEILKYIDVKVYNYIVKNNLYV